MTNANDFMRAIALAGQNGYDDVIANMCQEIEMRNRKDILAQHKFSISQVTEHRAGGDITRWRTHLPNAEGKKGKQIKKASRKDLEDAIVEFYRQRDKEDVLTFKDVYMEWREYHWQKNNSSNNTQDKYITDYFRYIHGQPLECMPITEISDQDLDSYFINTIRAEGIEYRTFGKLYGYISGTFKYAFKRRMIQSDPMSYLDKSDYRNTCVPKKEKTAESELIPDEDFNLILEQLYKDMQEHPDNFTYYAVELAAKMATRVGEIATLKWSDIDFKQGVITVCRSDKYNKLRDENGNVIKKWWSVEGTKTKKSRRFPIDESIKYSLDRIRRAQFEYGMVSEWVFPHPVYGWTHSLMIASCIKNKSKQLKLKKTYSIHALRKTFNSDLRNDNASSKMCASLIGNTPDVNDEYYYYDNTDFNEKRAAIEKVHKKRNFA